MHYIRNSGVLEHRDPQSWKWDLILATLKWPPEALRKLEESSCRIFLKKVTDFYLPSTNMFSRLELDSSRTRFHGRVGCCLLDFLLSCLPTVERQERQTEPEAAQRLDTLLAEVTHLNISSCMYVLDGNGEILVFFLFISNNCLNRQLSFKLEVLNHMGWYLGHKVLNIAPPSPLPQLFFTFKAL